MDDVGAILIIAMFGAREVSDANIGEHVRS
jgi:hypothetical protein